MESCHIAPSHLQPKSLEDFVAYATRFGPVSRAAAKRREWVRREGERMEERDPLEG